MPVLSQRPMSIAIKADQSCVLLHKAGVLSLCPKSSRIKAVVVDLHRQMWKLGMSNSAMHNEVLPGQHEISPIFAHGTVPADQNALCQDVCTTVLSLTG